jgi:hypothetical protein
MTNGGSSSAALEVTNIVERVELLREGQIKNFVYDGTTWVRAPLVPYPSAPMTSVIQGVVTVSNVTLTPFPSQACNSVLIKGARDNTGVIYVGGAGVSNLNGYELEPSESIVMNISNVNLLNAVAEVLNEKVRWLVIS